VLNGTTRNGRDRRVVWPDQVKGTTLTLSILCENKWELRENFPKEAVVWGPPGDH